MLSKILFSKMADKLTEKKQRKTKQMLSKMADKLTERKERKTRQR
jgi:hypothetical protein